MYHIVMPNGKILKCKDLKKAIALIEVDAFLRHGAKRIEYKTNYDGVWSVEAHSTHTDLNDFASISVDYIIEKIC